MFKRILIVFLLASFATPAHAYFCWGENSRDPRDIARDADVVFTGKVMKLEDMGMAPDELRTNRTNITFALEKAWKGMVIEDGQTVSADTEAFYEYDFKEGERYLVYGYRIYDGRISIVGCPRIKTVAESEKAIRTLGTPLREYGTAPKKPAKPIAAGPVNAPAPTMPEAPAVPAELLPEPVPVPVPAPGAEQMDEESVEDLLNTLQEETPPAPVAAPAPAEPEKQLDVIWEDKPAAAPAPAPAPEKPAEQLDVIWEDKPATPAAPVTPEMPEAPMPPAPPGGTP